MSNIANRVYMYMCKYAHDRSFNSFHATWHNWHDVLVAPVRWLETISKQLHSIRVRFLMAITL